MATVQLVGDYYTMTVEVDEYENEKDAFSEAASTIKAYYGWDIENTVLDYEVY